MKQKSSGVDDEKKGKSLPGPVQRGPQRRRSTSQGDACFLSKYIFQYTHTHLMGPILVLDEGPCNDLACTEV